jgi:NADH-quinone oxidoreductase subunit G
MSEITVKINGVDYKAKEGEFILNIARRENVFIPAICYQTGCSPTLACRLCIVEADGKRVYACNAKAKDGMDIITDSDEIAQERESIMQVYDVNHPLECGVCDQSGECELQDYTLYMGVKEQKYAIPDTYRPIRDWGLMKYDASLCIVCEKCITICKDMIGDSVLKTVPRGGEAVNKELKATMPKDAYAMWNKLQKSIIGTVNEDNSLDCQDCGECIAVCPVGALISTDFQYSANAWELRKVPASNPHSSDCSLLYYNIKHGDMKNYEERIFRVTNDAHYVPLHGGARFGFDFENKVAGKDKALFEKAVDFLTNKADTIRFSSYITNEEALILQNLKEKLGLKLVNEDAYAYQQFMKNFSSTSGKTLYSGDLNTIKASNFVISMGTQVRYDAPNVGYAINNAVTMNKGAGLYFHPTGDKVVEGFAKNMMSISHKPGSEEHILAFILDYFSKIEGLNNDLPKEIADIAAKYDKDAIALPEDFEAKMTKMLAKKDTFALVIGEDCYQHPRAENIARLAGAIDKYTNISVVVIPSKTNTLGVSLICDLDKEVGSAVLGYNAEGDFVLSALGDGDLDMPALNQQEGTFTSLNKRVVPTNAALGYSGYVLNDLANAVGFDKELTVDYTLELPEEKGYEAKCFDDLPNYFDNGGNEVRGYVVKTMDVKEEAKVEKLAKAQLLDKEIVYLSNPIIQFSPFTNKAHQLKTDGKLYVSAEYAEANGLAEGDKVEVKSDKGAIETTVEIDSQLTGDIPYLPTFDKALDTQSLFDGSRFTKATIRKV